MTHLRENLTTSNIQNVFYGNIANANAGTTIGGIIDVTKVYKTALKGINGNTANAVKQYGVVLQSINFRIQVLGYTSGAFTPILEGIGINQATPTDGTGYANGLDLESQASTIWSAVSDPYANPIYAVSNDKLVCYNYPTSATQSGSFVKVENNVLSALGTAISSSDATLATNKNLTFSFAYVPGFGVASSDYKQLRFSIHNGVNANATFIVNAEYHFQGLF